MPAPVKAVVKAGAAQPANFVKFSDKLTDSVNDIAKIIEQHKEMIDTIQEVAIELTSSISGMVSPWWL